MKVNEIFKEGIPCQSVGGIIKSAKTNTAGNDHFEYFVSNNLANSIV